jgi:hypothetical protein
VQSSLRNAPNVLARLPNLSANSVLALPALKLEFGAGAGIDIGRPPVNHPRAAYLLGLERGREDNSPLYPLCLLLYGHCFLPLGYPLMSLNDIKIAFIVTSCQVESSNPNR